MSKNKIEDKKNEPDIEVNLAKQSKENTITKDLLLNTIEELKKTSKKDKNLIITFYADSGGSAINIELSSDNNIDLSKINTFEDLEKDIKENKIQLSIERGVNKNHEVVYKKEEFITGDLKKIKFEPGISKILHSKVGKNVDKSDISNYLFKGEKEGGAHEAGKDGGIYELNGATYLIKKDDRDPTKTVAEYIANKAFYKAYPNLAPEISLVEIKDENNNKQVYLASKYFNNYTDMFKDNAKVLGITETPSRSNTNISESIRQLRSQDKKNKNADGNEGGAKEYKELYKVLATSILLNDFSIHSGNLGVVSENGKKTAVRVDFGSALRNVTREVEYDKAISGTGVLTRFFLNKNYLQKDYDKDIRLNKEFAEELYEASKLDLMPGFKEGLNDISKKFDMNAIKEFGIKSKFLSEGGVAAIYDENKLKDTINANAKKAFETRKQSLKNYASDIELELLAKESREQKKEIDREKLNEIIDKNKDYFTNIGAGLNKINFMYEENEALIPQINKIANEQFEKEINEKKNELNNDLLDMAKEYFVKNKDNANFKEFGEKIFSFMRDNGLSHRKISDDRLKKECESVAREIFVEKEKSIGFWESVKYYLDKFVSTITGRNNEMSTVAVKDLSQSLRIEVRDVLSNSKNFIVNPHNSATNNIITPCNNINNIPIKTSIGK